MLGQSDVSKARMIDQALVVSSPRSDVNRFGCDALWVLDSNAGSEEDALPELFRDLLSIIRTAIGRCIAPLKMHRPFFCAFSSHMARLSGAG